LRWRLERANTSRAAMHQGMDHLVDRVGKVEGSVAAVQEDISEMRPVTDDVRRWKLMGIGALAITGIGAMALGVTFAAVVRRVGRLFLGSRAGHRRNCFHNGAFLPVKSGKTGIPPAPRTGEIP
jgi:hypothetical protein